MAKPTFPSFSIFFLGIIVGRTLKQFSSLHAIITGIRWFMVKCWGKIGEQAFTIYADWFIGDSHRKVKEFWKWGEIGSFSQILSLPLSVRSQNKIHFLMSWFFCIVDPSPMIIEMIFNYFHYPMVERHNIVQLCVIFVLFVLYNSEGLNWMLDKWISGLHIGEIGKCVELMIDCWWEWGCSIWKEIPEGS
jgi:hypothetical protein